jgi:hypothetical protein
MRPGSQALEDHLETAERTHPLREDFGLVPGQRHVDLHTHDVDQLHDAAQEGSDHRAVIFHRFKVSVHLRPWALCAAFTDVHAVNKHARLVGLDALHHLAR